MPTASYEGAVSIVLALLVVVLEQAGVRNPYVLWGAFAFAAALSVDTAVRGEWANKIVDSSVRRTRRGLVCSLILVVFALFGYWVYTQVTNPVLPINSDIRVDPTTVKFGGVPVGKVSRIETITVLNRGSQNAGFKWDESKNNFAPFQLSGDYSFGFTGTCDNQFLAPGKSCTICVRFIPWFKGERDGDLKFVIDGQEHTVVLMGTGE
jgi:hypothetical protein